MNGRRFRDGVPVVGSRAIPGSCMQLVLQALETAAKPLTITELRAITGQAANRISACLAKMQRNAMLRVELPEGAAKGRFYQLRSCGMRVPDTYSPAETREQTYILLSQSAPKRVLIDTDLRPGEWYVVRSPHQHEREQLEKTA
jgi:hypothetical protein